MNEILKRIQKKRIEQLPYRKIHPYMADVNDAYDQGFEDGAEFALKNQWISVDEALPEEDPDCNKWLLVLVRGNTEDGGTNYFLQLGLYRGNGRFSCETRNIKVVAWMLVPETEE